MSKYVKYISSAHYGAPVMKGDRWGYCVEMLRTCLVTGFNERLDLNNVEVLTANTVKYSFATAHNYVEHQTIKVKDVSLAILNGDALVLSSTTNTVTCKIYNDVTAHIGTSLAVTASAKVAPLGFREKFTDPNGRSVFVTDEVTENAYFYIDDTRPINWVAGGTYTSLIAPIVFMTDKMTDIDTVTGRYIAPYDSSNPTYYKLKDYMAGTSQAQGLLNFVSYGILNSAGNTAAQRDLPMSYSVIGNGRMFYFIPDTNVSTAINNNKFIFGFGKYKSVNQLLDSPYILLANGYKSASATGYKDYSRVQTFAYNKALNETNGVIADLNNYNATDLGRINNVILKAGTSPSAVWFSNAYNKNNATTDMAGASYPSGTSVMAYPELNTKKFYATSMKMYNTQKYFGEMSGILWTFNTNGVAFTHGTVLKFKNNGDDKKLLIYRYQQGHHNNSNTQVMATYAFSFDYKDWGNYD